MFCLNPLVRNSQNLETTREISLIDKWLKKKKKSFIHTMEYDKKKLYIHGTTYISRVVLREKDKLQKL